MYHVAAPLSNLRTIAAYSHQIEVREPARWVVLSDLTGQDQDGRIPENPVQQ
jgi:hypothetical protein